jgi:hypothetical protein
MARVPDAGGAGAEENLDGVDVERWSGIKAISKFMKVDVRARLCILCVLCGA